MNPFSNGHDLRNSPLHGTPNFPPMDEPNISPFQQYFLGPQPQQHSISQRQPLPLGHVSNSSFPQHGTFGPQSQRHSVPGRQAIIERPVMPQLLPSPTEQPMPQSAPQWSQSYPQLGSQSAPRAPVTIDFEALMSHSPWPQSSFQESPLDPCLSTSDWMKPQELLTQSSVQEPTQNFHRTFLKLNDPSMVLH